MNTTGLVKYAGALVALAICSACSGSATAPTAALNYRYVGKTLSVNGRLVTAARLSPGLRYATILPDRHAKSGSFEYIGGLAGTGIFNYPKSDKEVGQDS